MGVVILGSGESVANYNQDNHKSDKVWAVGSSFENLTNKGYRVNTYFCLHKDQVLNTEIEQIDLDSYPLDEIVDEYNSTYFTNSISYMLAYALYMGETKVHIYGVDMDTSGEYNFERPSFCYWLGFLRGKGVEVYLASYIDKPVFLYGFDSDIQNKLLHRISVRKDITQRYIRAYKESDDNEMKDVFINQYLGRYADLKYWEQELKG